MVAAMDVSDLREHIEELVAEEHKLLSERAESGLEDERHQRLEAIQTELDRTWDLLRRREAGIAELLNDEDVPDPPNDLDGPDSEPLHLDHGLHADGASPDPGPHPNAP
jgi:hypothetical protein